MKLKLTPIQKHRLDSSYRELSAVLQEIKSKSLTPPKVYEMKILERAVQHLETFIVL